MLEGNNKKLAYNVKGAADYLGVSKKTIYTLRKAGIIKCIKMGRDYIFPRSELDCFSINCKEDGVFLSMVNEVLRCEK